MSPFHTVHGIHYSLKGLIAKVEAPILWPPDEKSQLIEIDSEAGKD